MHKRILFIALILGLISPILSQLNAQAAIELKINGNDTGPELSPYLYGLFFEDINFGADGGLYAELVQNRSFEYFPVRGELNDAGYDLTPYTAWEKIFQDSVIAEVIVTRVLPLNEVNNNNMEIYIKNNKGWAGVANTGFDGIPLVKDASYNFSIFIRQEKRNRRPDFGYKTVVLLEDENGNILDSTEIKGVTDQWQKIEATLTPNASAKNGKLVLLAHGRSRIQIDMVSLFPAKTYKGRKNGLRKDLAESLEALQPKFLRFPGGCIAHGWGIENFYNWKKTLGNLEDRTPNWNRWGYHQTYGLGYFEYFQLCEDLGATPLPVVFVGVACGFTQYECVPMEDMDQVVQDALDLVEFANGPVDSKWGKIRAEMGHPEPFNLEYICLGNEEHDYPEFYERFPLFAKAFKEKYPDLKLIGNSGLSPNVPLYNFMAENEMHSSDEHYYMRPEWFIENQTRFDDWDRSKPKVFVGEYASQGVKLFNALAEATYLTGIERNADIVEMAAYAPLFARYGNTQWRMANLIYFDNQQVVKTPNYHVQQMFSVNKGDIYIKSEKTNWPGNDLAVSCTYDNSAEELIVKIVNTSDKSETVNIELNSFKGISKSGNQVMLTGNKDDVNNRENPENIKQVNKTLKTGKKFAVKAPAYSVQVIRMKAKR